MGPRLKSRLFSVFTFIRQPGTFESNVTLNLPPSPGMTLA
jgi:hypothetical protein